MPLYEYLCKDCGKTFELLMLGATEKPTCTSCGSERLEKLLSAPSDASGLPNTRFPGPGDTACCGSSPGHAGCEGPGSCCGRR